MDDPCLKYLYGIHNILTLIMYTVPACIMFYPNKSMRCKILASQSKNEPFSDYVFDKYGGSLTVNFETDFFLVLSYEVNVLIMNISTYWFSASRIRPRMGERRGCHRIYIVRRTQRSNHNCVMIYYCRIRTTFTDLRSRNVPLHKWKVVFREDEKAEPKTARNSGYSGHLKYCSTENIFFRQCSPCYLSICRA